MYQSSQLHSKLLKGYSTALFLCIITALFCLCACSTRSIGKPLASAKSLDFKPPQTVKFKLSTGLSVILINDPELPLVAGSLSFPGGSLYEAAGQIGLMAALGSQMREGGAGDLGPEQLDAKLEDLAAEIDSSFGDEFGSVSFSCLSSDLDQTLPIFADVVLRPRFEPSRLALWKKQSLEGIRRRRDNDETVLFIAAKQLLYGDSPRGRITRSEDIEKIGRVDLLRAHRRFVVPDQAILSVAGNITQATLQPLLEKYFANWQRSNQSLAPLTNNIPQPAAGLYFIEMPFKQAGVVIAQLGVPRHTPDEFSIDVFNELFGGGSFDSRLVEAVRERQGLAYVVYGQVSQAAPIGSNIIFFQTEGGRVAQAMLESVNVLKSMQSSEVSKVELDDVKRTIENSFVFKFDRASEIAARQAGQKLLGYAEDYDAKYLKEIEQVKAEDLVSVAARLWDPAKFVVVVVGDKSAYNSLIEKRSLLDQLGLKSTQIKRLQFDQTLKGI